MRILTLQPLRRLINSELLNRLNSRMVNKRLNSWLRMDRKFVS